MKIILTVFLFTLSSVCFASEPDCSMFGFNAKRDSPGIEILDYKYGSSGIKGTFAEPNKPVSQGYGVVEGGLNGDRLFVKWLNKESGKIFTENVELKGHLPDFPKTTCEIFFAIKKDLLYIFLITQELRPKEWPPVDTNPVPLVTDYVKVFLVYPYGKKTVD